MSKIRSILHDCVFIESCSTRQEMGFTTAVDYQGIESSLVLKGAN